MKVLFKKAEKPTWIQKLIGWRTYSAFSHVEIMIDEMCYSSVFPKGIRAEKAEKVYTKPWEWQVVDLEPLNLSDKAVKEWFERHENCPYDTRSLLEILEGKASSDANAFNCAESILSSLQHAGILEWYDSSRATPEGLYLALMGLLEGVIEGRYLKEDSPLQ